MLKPQLIWCNGLTLRILTEAFPQAHAHSLVTRYVSHLLNALILCREQGADQLGNSTSGRQPSSILKFSKSLGIDVFCVQDVDYSVNDISILTLAWRIW